MRNKVERIIGKTKKRRGTRLEAYYKVVYADSTDRAEHWISKKDLRKLKGNERLLVEYEAELAREAEQDAALLNEEEEEEPFDAFQPVTQEPFQLGLSPQDHSAQNESSRRIQLEGSQRLMREIPLVPADNETTRHSTPPRRRLSGQTLSAGRAGPAGQHDRLSTRADATPDPLWMTQAQLKDMDSLFPPMAPVPGFPLYKAVLRDWPAQPYPPRAASAAEDTPSASNDTPATISTLNPLLPLSTPKRRVPGLELDLNTHSSPGQTLVTLANPQAPGSLGRQHHHVSFLAPPWASPDPRPASGPQEAGPADVVGVSHPGTSSKLSLASDLEDSDSHEEPEPPLTRSKARLAAQANSSGTVPSAEASQRKDRPMAAKASKQPSIEVSGNEGSEDRVEEPSPPKTRSKTRLDKASALRGQGSTRRTTSAQPDSSDASATLEERRAAALLELKTRMQYSTARREAQPASKRRRLSTGSRLEHPADLLLAAAASTASQQTGQQPASRGKEAPKQTLGNKAPVTAPKGLPSLSPRRKARQFRSPSSFQRSFLWSPWAPGQSVPAPAVLARQSEGGSGATAGRASQLPPYVPPVSPRQQAQPSSAGRGVTGASRGQAGAEPTLQEAVLPALASETETSLSEQAQPAPSAARAARAGPFGRGSPEPASAQAEPEAAQRAVPPPGNAAPKNLQTQDSGLAALVFALQSEIKKRDQLACAQRVATSRLGQSARDSSVEIISESSSSDDEESIVGTQDPAWNALEGFFAKQINGDRRPQVPSPAVQTAESSEEEGDTHEIEEPSRTPSVGPAKTQDMEEESKGDLNTTGPEFSSQLRVAGMLLSPDLRHRLSKEEWQTVEIIGARQRQDGVQLHVQWHDGHSMWLLTEILKRFQHCLLKMVDYYESKVKRVGRT